MKELSPKRLKELLRMMLSYCIAYIKNAGASERAIEELKKAHRQIRKLIMEKPKVTRKFIETWACNINDVWAGKIKEKDFIIKLLKEAGIEVEK